MPDRRFDGHRVSGAWDIVLTEARRQGVRFLLNSGRRTIAEQWVLWRAYKAGGTLAAFPSPIAPHIRVGRANHAIDVNSLDGGETRLQQWLQRQGVHPTNPVRGEAWHMELARSELIALARRIKRSQRKPAAKAKVKPVPKAHHAAAKVSRVSAAGVKFVAGFEGFRSKPYRDPVGVWTIGYGETRGVTAHTPAWTEQHARERLRVRIDRDYLAPVLKLADVVGLRLTQNEADALASFVYNLGPGVLDKGRTMGDAIRSKNRRRIADAFLPYDKAGNPPRALPGLTRRRKAERALFLKH